MSHTSGRPHDWRSRPHSGWIDMPLYANGDPAAYASAAAVARMFGTANAQGPYVWLPDGSHRVRAGWTLQPDGRYLRTDKAASEAEAMDLARQSLAAKRRGGLGAFGGTPEHHAAEAAKTERVLRDVIRVAEEHLSAKRFDRAGALDTYSTISHMVGRLSGDVVQLLGRDRGAYEGAFNLADRIRGQLAAKLTACGPGGVAGLGAVKLDPNDFSWDVKYGDIVPIGYLRGGLNFGLASVVWAKTLTAIYGGPGMLQPNGVYAIYAGSMSSADRIGTAYTEADARKVLGEAKREEARTYASWSSHNRGLRHEPGKPFLRDLTPATPRR